jgi:hypothetical protein
MSAVFHEITHPCKECVVRAACEHLQRRKDAFRLDEFHSSILCLQSNSFHRADKTDHRNDLVEAWINFGCKLMRNIEIDNVKLSPQILFFKHILEMMQYIVNSKTWRDKTKIQPFDYEEVLNRLKICKLKLE